MVNGSHFSAEILRGNQGRRKHQKIGGGGTCFQGHFRILKRAPKKGTLATGGIFPSYTIPKLHVFDQIYFKNIEISKEKGHL
jgi:hypothetical protein